MLNHTITLLLLGIIIFPSSQPPDLHQILNPNGCDTTCWQGLEPGVTTEAEAMQLLSAQNIDYKAGMLAVPNDSWIWSLDNINTLLDQDQKITVITEFYQQIVSRVWLLNANICAVQVIDAYGTPNTTVVTKVPDGFVIDIYYFDEKLAFFGSSQNAPYFDSAFVAQEDFLRRYAGKAQTTNWSSVSEEYSVSC